MIEFGTLFATSAQKQRSPSPRTNRAGVQKEGEKGKTTTTTLTTTTTSLVVVCVFKTLSQTRGDSKLLFFQTSFGGGPFQTREARALRERKGQGVRRRRPGGRSRPSLARMVCALFLESFLGQSRSRHTHTRERERLVFFSWTVH